MSAPATDAPAAESAAPAAEQPKQQPDAAKQIVEEAMKADPAPSTTGDDAVPTPTKMVMDIMMNSKNKEAGEQLVTQLMKMWQQSEDDKVHAEAKLLEQQRVAEEAAAKLAEKTAAEAKPLADKAEQALLRVLGSSDDPTVKAVMEKFGGMLQAPAVQELLVECSRKAPAPSPAAAPPSPPQLDLSSASTHGMGFGDLRTGGFLEGCTFADASELPPQVAEQLRELERTKEQREKRVKDQVMSTVESRVPSVATKAPKRRRDTDDGAGPEKRVNTHESQNSKRMRGRKPNHETDWMNHPRTNALVREILATPTNGLRSRLNERTKCREAYWPGVATDDYYTI